MDKAIVTKIKGEVETLLQEIGKANDQIYTILFGMYVAFFVYLKIEWNENIYNYADMIRFFLLSIILWGTAIYIFMIIASWKNLWNRTLLLIIVGGLIAALTGYGSTLMTTNSFGVVMDFLFIILSYRKDYKKLLRNTMIITLCILVFAYLGVFIRITIDVVKPNNIHPGHSLGINYPNNWGYLVFLAALIGWYLYLRFKPLFTFIIYWTIAFFMFFYISCRTIAGFMIVFPFLALIVDQIEKHTKTTHFQKIDKKRPLSYLFGTIFTVMPFLMFAFMYFTSTQVEWVHKHFYYTEFHNLAMRFVQGGLYFSTYGIPLVGNPYRGNVYNYINVNGDFLEVGILDSSFASYLIMRGLIWMILVLIWLCMANYKGIKKQDYAIPFLCLILLGFAMLERPGLELWYNFILLYPLAKVVSSHGADRCIDLSDDENIESYADSSITSGFI